MFRGSDVDHRMGILDEPVVGRRDNAVLGWVMIGTVAVGAVESLLTSALLWAGFSLLVAAVTSVPALVTRNWRAVVPWPLPTVAAAAVVARAVGFYPEAAGFLAIAALSFVVVVEIDAFTPVELSRRFAVVFGVLTTMAVEALWVVAQYLSDALVGTTFLRTQTELQEDIVIVTVVGVAMGGLSYWYFVGVDSEESADRSSGRVRTR